MKLILMRMKFAIPMLLCTAMALVSCSKDDAGPDTSFHPGGPYFVGMKQGTGKKDTSFVFKYNTNKQVEKVTNTTTGASVTGTYDSTGNLSQVVAKYDGSVVTISYTYDAENRLTKTSTKRNAAVRVYTDTLVYTNGALVKKTTYVIDPDINNGKPTFWGYNTYQMTDSNITNIKTYDVSNYLVGETKLTYNSDPNVFKSISLFNVDDQLGTFEIASDETYFNKNMLAGVTTITNTQARVDWNFTFIYNDNKQLIKAVTTQTFNGGLWGTYTRAFSY